MTLIRSINNNKQVSSKQSPRRVCRLVACLTLIACVTVNTGCTTTRAHDIYNEGLQERIREGNLIKPGDYVTIHTRDNTVHEFKVSAIDDQHVEGRHISLPIDDIAALKTESLDIAKTVGYTAATGAGLYLAYLGVLLAAAGLLF